VWVSSRTFEAGYLYTNSPYVYGILEAIDGLGQSMGEVLPDDRYGSLVLNSDRGSYKAKGRIYDLLDKYSIINQDVTIYSFQKKDSQIGNSSDLEVEFIGVSSRAFANTQEAKMTIEVRSENISTDTPLLQITSELFPNTDQANIGYRLPVIFGSAQVPAKFILEQIEPDNLFSTFNSNRLTSEAAFATFFPNFSYVGSTISLRANSLTGYRAIINGDILTPFYETPFTSGAVGIASPQETGPVLRGLVSAQQNRILTTVVFVAQGNLPSWPADQNEEALFIVRVYELGPKIDDVRRLVATGSRFKIDFEAQIKTNSPSFFTFNVLVVLDKMVPLSNFYGYLITVDQTGTSSGFVDVPRLTASNYEVLIRYPGYESGGENNFVRYQRSTPQFRGSPVLELIGADFSSLADSNFQKIEFSQFSSTQELAPFSELDFFINSQGIRDTNNYLGGGSAALITRADRIAKFLIKLSFDSQNKTIPTDSEDLINTSKFSVATYCGNLSGLWSDGSIRDALTEILYNSSSRLAPKRSGGFNMWSYGIDDEPVKIINESDCTLESVQVTGEDEIINSISISYDFREFEKGFRKASKKRNLDSINFYGIKELSLNAEELKFVRDDSQAERWLDYKLARFSKERLQITVTIPYWKDMYRQIELLDKIIISHVALPSHYGSGTADEERPITTDGDSLGADYNLGDLWRRAKSLPLRVIGRNPIFSEGSEPMIQLKLEGIEQ
jgi:hypothetical protein